MKLQRYAVVTGAGLMAVASLTACSSTKSSTASSSTGGTSATTSGAAATTSSSAAISCGTGTLNLSGSTAQQNAINQWIKDYQTACPGVKINYTGNGSGAGYTDFTNKTSDFAGSDFPMADSQQAAADARCGSGNKAIDLPMVPGAIAALYNIKGVSAQLNLSAPTLAKIFSGAITTWNDAAIAKDNPGVTLPGTKITVFFRSDGSGTSFNFSNYLNNLDKADFPAAANKQWPGKVGQGVKGSQGVVQGVGSTDGGIGYAEISFAGNGVTAAKVGNAAGQFVDPTPDNAKNFVAKAKVQQNGNDTRLAFDYTYSDPSAYPATLVTYEFVCASGNDAAKLPLIKGFLGYMDSDAAQGELPNSGYVALPTTVQAALKTVISGLS